MRLLRCSKSGEIGRSEWRVVPRYPSVWGVPDEHGNRVLNAYMEAGVKHSSHHLETSSAVDKARVFGRGFVDCFAATPAGVGWWGAPLDSMIIKWRTTDYKVAVVELARSIEDMSLAALWL